MDDNKRQERIISFKNLEKGYLGGSYGETVSLKTIDISLDISMSLLGNNIPVYPTPEGYILFECENRNNSIYKNYDITVREKDIEVWFYNVGEEEDKTFIILFEENYIEEIKNLLEKHFI